MNSKTKDIINTVAAGLAFVLIVTALLIFGGGLLNAALTVGKCAVSIVGFFAGVGILKAIGAWEY